MISIPKLNQCIFRDCLDPEVGLSIFPDEYFSYTFTDPPFNIGYFDKTTLTHHGRSYSVSKSIPYPDNLPPENYLELCKNFFKECRRVSRAVIIYCGARNIDLWREKIEKPDGYLYRIIPNSKGGSSVSWTNCVQPILVYGDLGTTKSGRKKRFVKDWFIYNAQWGFLRKLNVYHPCPVDYDFWYDLITSIRPKENDIILDPFLGSGTTSVVCKRIGVSWLGYEKYNEEYYKIDQQKRLSEVIPLPRTVQKKLFVINQKIEKKVGVKGTTLFDYSP